MPNRRNVLKATVLTTAALSLPATTSSCASSVAKKVAIEWFPELVKMLGVELVVSATIDIAQTGWKNWSEGLRGAQEECSNSDWQYYSSSVYGDSVPPALLFPAFRSRKYYDPDDDFLVVVVNGGKDAVFLSAWAWRAIYLFVSDLTDGKSGDTLAGFRALCLISLIPSGKITDSRSLTKRSQIVEYQTRNGRVEIVRTTDEDGKIMAKLTATGIPNSENLPTVREFDVSSDSSENV